jgi:hypothetical protein
VHAVPVEQGGPCAGCARYRQALAAAKAAVNRSTLPPVGDLVAAFEEFVQSLGRPGFQVRAAATAAIGAEVGLDFEYRMGEYIAEANRQL